MLRDEDIETQLTQRRLDVEDLKLKDKQNIVRINDLKTQLAEMQKQIDNLNLRVDQLMIKKT